MEMIGKRIADTRILRLIRKWLDHRRRLKVNLVQDKVGISLRSWPTGLIEDGIWSETKTGMPQGAVISPLLANIYLHYVLDQWTDQWRQSAQGDVIIVRYADDAVIGFQHEREAKKFLEDLGEQLGEHGLELNEDKTRLIRFGRFAQQNRDERGEGATESFTFLGFQHICTENSLGRFDARPCGADRRIPAKRTQWLLSIPCGSRKSDGAVAIPETGRPLLVPCAGTAQPKAARLGKAGEAIRSMATRSKGCS